MIIYIATLDDAGALRAMSRCNSAFLPAALILALDNMRASAFRPLRQRVPHEALSHVEISYRRCNCGTLVTDLFVEGQWIASSAYMDRAVESPSNATLEQLWSEAAGRRPAGALRSAGQLRSTLRPLVLSVVAPNRTSGLDISWLEELHACLALSVFDAGGAHLAGRGEAL